MDPFLAEVRIFPFNFAPTGWALCNGQLLPISQNTALFSLLGTTYGGDGKSTFALPNLQGSFTIGQGQGPGLSLHDLGETGGSDTVTLLTNQMPAHSHSLMATSSASTTDPTGAALAPTANGSAAYRLPGTTTAMAANAVSTSGGAQPHNNLPPYLTLNFCIAMQGIFPARS